MRNKLLKLSVGLITTATLTACGGGVTGSTPVGSAGRTVQAQFVDAPVSNLHYSSLSNFGDTDASGHFNCNLDQEVTFSIGALTLGKSICQRIVTPQTISATITQSTAPQSTTSASGVVTSNGTKTQATVTATAQPHDPEVVNRVRLLMSLDTDGDATNGIQLPSPADLKKSVTATTIDFKNTSNFDNQAATVVSNLAPVINSNAGLRSTTEAQTHFDATLQTLPSVTATPANAPTATPVNVGQYYDDANGGFDENRLEAEHSEFNEQNESERGESNQQDEGR
jgi:hypothetical protein